MAVCESAKGLRSEALRERIERAMARMRRLPAAEQQRLFAQSRARSPTLFALLGRFQADPALRPLLRVAVERTRIAPAEAELARAVSRSFNSAFRAGRRRFRQAMCFVLDRLREEFGADNARRVTLAALQRRYLALSARSREAGFDAPGAVLAVASVAEAWNGTCGDANPLAAVVPEDAAVTATIRPDGAAPAGDGSQSPVPVEDELLAAGMVAACFHIAAGVRDFSEFADAMALDLGDAVRPYLRLFFEAIRHYPGFDLSAMKPAVEVSGGFGF